MDKAFGCEFIIQEKHKNFLNLFPPFKETLEKYEGEELLVCSNKKCEEEYFKD